MGGSTSNSTPFFVFLMKDRSFWGKETDFIPFIPVSMICMYIRRFEFRVNSELLQTINTYCNLYIVDCALNINIEHEQNM